MEILVANLRGSIRRQRLNGREYIVAPLTLIVPGVLNGSRGPLYYPPEEIAADPSAWNHMPIVVYHPTRNGTNITARDPDILDKQGIGVVLRARINKTGKLVAEGWFDVQATRNVDDRILMALELGEPIELSTGLFTQNEPSEGTANGREYTHIARNYKPDHLAILPDQVGACSINDGCGVLVNAISEAWSTSVWKESAELVCNCATANARGSSTIARKGDMGKAARAESSVLKSIDDDDMDDEDDDEEEIRRENRKRMAGKKATANQEILQWRSDMGLEAQDRKALIDHLVANCECWKDEGDREVLNKFSDEKLLKLKEDAARQEKVLAVANRAAEGFKDSKTGKAYRVNPTSGKWELMDVVNTDPKEDDEEGEDTEETPPEETTNKKGRSKTKQAAKKPQTMEDWVRNAPVEVQNKFRYADEIEQREKSRLIDQLLANVSPSERAAHQERLYRRSIEELSNDLALIPKMPTKEELAAVSKPSQQTRQTANRSIGDEDMLGLPTINWQEAEEGNGKGPQSEVTQDIQSLSGDDWLKNAPAEYRTAVVNAMAIERNEKRKLVEQLTANVADEDMDKRLTARLMSKSLEELRDLAALAPQKQETRPNYFGAAAPLSNTRHVETVNRQEDILLPPASLSFEEHKEKRA